ncbi:hypothetical protein Afer_0748 [Acidimicrobium ferrooxidans DSM 10331]|uniref:Uncharacterized protein n=1 Tax=Acidimicrobium ferrooxidans (strain DSM 10331 / JCM 15462 / NBRC 103882 / ICP) TaxID=525909 RepID=C7LY90_ACIFD|nr:hypothetical protein [Acidimicrobium ferrooxidans]ACU53698.1 hypothetical protein Afer_0748 [Acidimicrobium ferrooxidans DSM 10331]
MILRRRILDPERLLAVARALEPRASLVDGVLDWEDGPSLDAMAAHLTTTFGPVRLVAADYLGASWIAGPPGRATEQVVNRTLGPAALLVVVLRAWGAWGPLGPNSQAPPDGLARIAETPGDYPIPTAMARILLEGGAEPSRPTDAIELVARVGYERLWAEAWTRFD